MASCIRMDTVPRNSAKQITSLEYALLLGYVFRLTGVGGYMVRIGSSILDSKLYETEGSIQTTPMPSVL